MSTRGHWIHGMGLVGPLGDQTAAVAAAVHAGICRHRRGDLRNRRGEPMIVTEVPDDALPPLAPARELAPRTARLLRLATHALREASAALPDDFAVPVHLALPEPPFAAHPEFLADLQTQTGVRLDLAASRLAPPGRAGPLQALADAPAGPFLLGGVDTHHDPELLARLDRDRRVHAPGVRDGFVPGEGAAFLLLSHHRELAGARARFFLTAPALGHQDPRARRGDGLAAAVSAVTDPRPRGELRLVHAGLNGESQLAREWLVAELRARDAFAPDVALEHPVDCIGDPGAALAPTLVALAAFALTHAHHAGPALVWTASDGPARAAIILEDHGDT